MTEKQVKLKVIARAGVWLPGSGSRKYGDHFVLKASKARDLAKRYPDSFELVDEPGETAPPNTAAESKPEPKAAESEGTPSGSKTKVSTKSSKADQAE